MKRNLLNILFLFFVIPLIFSCQEESILSFKIVENKYNVVEDGGEIVVEVISSAKVSYSIDTDCDWLEMTSQTEEGQVKKIIFHIDINPNSTPRTTIIDISAKDAGVKGRVTVIQAGRTTIYPIPDKNFKTYLLDNFDTNNDGKITIEEAIRVKTIDCSNMNIKSVEGIENFENLITLRCHNNQIKKLTIHSVRYLAELECYNNPIEILDMGETNPLFIVQDKRVKYPFFPAGTLLDSQTFAVMSNKVMSISVENQQLRTVDVTLCPALARLFCKGNMIEEIDVKQNASLEKFDCSNNEIISINLLGNRFLDSLDCSENRINELDLSANKEIADLIVSYNNLQQLDISGNHMLKTLVCSNNTIGSIDVSNCAYLTYLDCNNNDISQIDISSNLSVRALVCDSNPLVLVDLGASQVNRLELIGGLEESRSFKLVGANVQEMRVNENSLVSLDVSEAASLLKLYCSSNELDELNLANNTKLRVLECYDNKFSTLDISKTSLNGGILDCAPMRGDFRTLYIGVGWSIPNVYPIKNPEYIPNNTTVDFR